MNKKNSALRKFSIALFFILLAILIFKITVKQSNFKPVKNTAESSGLIKLPVDINNPNLGMVFVVYNFYGQIKEIKGASDSAEIVLDVKDNNLPQFMVDARTTQIFKPGNSQNNPPIPVILQDLKKGQNINIQSLYDLKLKNWKVIRIDTF